MTNKHAYLIIAHKSDYTFTSLIQLLDDPLNDIYVHMDKKNTGFNERTISTKYSKLTFVERICVTWGGYSQIQSELILLKHAVLGEYKYYHLLSGEDLPIKSQAFIHQFFDTAGEKIFLDFYSKDFIHYERINYYHLFQEHLGKKNSIFWNRWFIKGQKILGIKRSKGNQFGKGANWFSIPHAFAQYIVDNEAWIDHIFRHTLCGDELFAQTLLLRSPYADWLFYNGFDDNTISIMREIDWKRGNPYIFRRPDFDNLMESDRMFARKFDCKIDREIIDRIKEQLLSKQKITTE